MFKTNFFKNPNFFYKDYLITSIFLFFLFIITFLFFKFGLFSFLDIYVFENITNLSNLFIYNVANFISLFSSFFAMFIIFILLTYYLFSKKKFKELKLFYLIIFLNIVIVYPFKFLISRARPGDALALTSSFPSGHTTLSVVVFGFIIYLFYKNYKILSFFSLFLLLSVGVSRVIINIHWFTDVLAGYFLGFSILYFGFYLFFKNSFLFKIKVKYLET